MVSKDEIIYKNIKSLLPIGFLAEIRTGRGNTINIPTEIINALKLKKGDFIEVEITEHYSNGKPKNLGVDLSLITGKKRVGGDNRKRRI